MLLFFSISLITIVSILLILSLLPQTPPTFKLKISTQLYAIFFIRPQTFMSRFSPLILYIQHQNALTRIKITVNFTPLPLVLISIRIYLVKKKKFLSLVFLLFFQSATIISQRYGIYLIRYCLKENIALI